MQDVLLAHWVVVQPKRGHIHLLWNDVADDVEVGVSGIGVEEYILVGAGLPFDSAEDSKTVVAQLPLPM